MASLLTNTLCPRPHSLPAFLVRQVSGAFFVQATNEDGSDVLPYIDGLPVILVDDSTAASVRVLACPPSSGAIPWFESRSGNTGPVAAALVWPVGRGRLVWLGSSFGNIVEAAPWVSVVRAAVVALPRDAAPPVGGGSTPPAGESAVRGLAP